MNSYTFFWNKETWKRHSETNKFERVPIKYIAGADKRPFSELKTGDEVFIVTVSDGNLYLGGRLCVACNPLSRDEAATQLGENRLLDKELYVLANEDHLDFFRPACSIKNADAKSLDLYSIDSDKPKPPALNKNSGSIDGQAFRSPLRLSEVSAHVLRNYLGLPKVKIDGFDDANKNDNTEGPFDPASKDAQVPEPSYRQAVDDTESAEVALPLQFAQTEIDAWVKQRLGQGAFRTELLPLFDRKCALSGVRAPRLLIASHIRPWSKSDHAARRDPNNGLLLSVTWDALFDKGMVTFDDDGTMLVSKYLDVQTRNCLGIQSLVNLPKEYLTESRKTYLKYHREKCFERWLKESENG